MPFILKNLGLFALFNFLCYSIIPFFVQRSGATLLNISNVTTVIWSMLFDILVFDKKFQVLYVVAFILEITGVIIFSSERPSKPEKLNKDCDNVQNSDLEIPALGTREIDQLI